MNNKTKSSAQSDATESDNLDLILKIYDGALDSFNKAKSFYESEKPDDGYRELEQAKKLVNELYTTLESEKRHIIAKKLEKIYDYLLNQCILAQTTKELKIIDDNISVLGNLREGWRYLKERRIKD